MPDTYPKPPPFRPGARGLSASALNQLRDAVPRLITGGNGIDVRKYGDKVLISLGGAGIAAPGAAVLCTITEIEDEYLVCTRLDGGTINVAKPWTLRRGSAFPAGFTYTYDSAAHRTADDGTTTEDQYITPAYAADEQIMAMRVPSTGVETGDAAAVVWVDMNMAGRVWAPVVSAGSQAVLMTVDRVYAEYLRCVYNSEYTYVARPWALRRNVNFPAKYGYVYVYGGDQIRTASDGTVTETQIITPEYESGEEIAVVRVDNTGLSVGGVDITWLDLNITGRSWARAY